MTGHHDQSMYQCKTCHGADPVSAHMFTCDRCREWEHFRCAGISEAAQSRPFICKLCRKGETSTQRVLRSQTKGNPLTNPSVAGAPSNKGSKMSSVRSFSSQSSVVKAQLELAEEETRMKQKELEEEEELKTLELEEERKQLEAKKKLVEEEARLRQRTLEANRERLAKQQSIRRESLEKRNEILLQISERGSVLESTTSSVEKVSKWLNTHPPGGMTEGNIGGAQIDPLSSAPNGLQGGISCTVPKPSRTGSTSALPPNFPRQVTENGQPLDTLRSGLHASRVSIINPSHTLPRTVFPREVHSVTVREPFQQYVASSRPFRDPRLVPTASPLNSPAVYSCPPMIQHAARPIIDEGNQAVHINQRSAPSMDTPLHHSSMRNPRSVVLHSNTPVADQRFQDRDSFPEHGLSGDRFSRRTMPKAQEMRLEAGVLSTQQIAARQVVGKDLPSFNGNPTDWPMFITSFEQSTVACGYSNAENLVRLQRCLTGHAREAVRSRLLLPANVPHVVDTLRTLYGRPELLIRSLHEKIKGTPGPRHDRPETILEFGLVVQNFVDHLQAAQQEEHLSNPMLLQELVEKLPGSMRMDWAAFKSQHFRATVTTFGEFMTKLVKAASEVSFEIPGLWKGLNDGKQQRTKERARIQTHSAEETSSSRPADTSTRKTPKPCAICDREGHRVAECSKFKQLSIDDRWKSVQNKNLCRTCLNNHGKWPCKSWQGCGSTGCKLKHHTLLHSPSTPPTSSHSVNVSSSQLSAGEHRTLFRVLPVILCGREKTVTIFAFIDEGSQITMLEEKVAKELGVTGPKKPLTLQWTGNVKRSEPGSQEVSLKIAGKNSGICYDLRQARTVSCLLLPTQSMNYRELCAQFPHLRGLPIEDQDLVQPKLLIGLDNLRLVVPQKLHEGGAHDPIAAKCRLGWSIYGSTSTNSVARVRVNFHTAAEQSPDDLLNAQLRDYFALENCGVAAPAEKLESEEDKRARRLLEETTRRTATGFETGLLWRSDTQEFPDTYPMALRRLKCLEKKLQGNSSMMERVREQIIDFETKGYIRKVSEAEQSKLDYRKTWFLPLGIVLNPKKPGKLRLIWDAAAKVGGVSFNTHLLKGPDLLTPLPRVLSGFRLFPVAISGDIREMFLQIRLQPGDRNAQMFLFRNHPQDPVQTYAIDVTMFGSTCSPSSAQYVKNVNAEQHAEHYPRAAAAIIEHHYVDDYLDSFRTVEEAVQVVNDVKLVHSRGGFEIRNFLCNKGEVLRRTGEIEPDSSKEFALVRAETTESVLGMKWLPEDDVFTYTFAMRDDLKPILADKHIPTKREVLKVIMSLFDPLGFIAYFLVHGKVLMQDIWASGIDWDDEIGEELLLRWQQWTSYFPQLDSLRIPRCYFQSPFPTNFDRLELHVLVDASDSAYACVAYYRLETESGVQVALIGAKTKVAPLKVLSIPRLELKAAILGVRMLETVQGYHTYPVSRRILWSDSSTVLAWIRSEHRRYNKFVAVRIGEILTATNAQEWRWVPSGMNTADIATKWKGGPDFSHNSPWFQGPAFLSRSDEHWPQQTTIHTTHEELRVNHVHSSTSPLIDATRFSQWTKIHRTTAYVIQFVQNLRRKCESSTLQLGVLQQEELKCAEEVLWKVAQADAFPEEIAALSNAQEYPNARHRCVPKSSPIYKNWPFLDERGVLRMRGRIGAAAFIPTETKFPAILPRQHIITFLLTDWYHRRFRHANRETVANEIRQRFEIAKLRALIQKVMKACMMCKVARATPNPPAMAPLPAARLQPFVRPFTFVGLDYFGPVLVKVGRSQVKIWVALFTCLTIRAVHLEVVHSLSTESCVMAVRRFIARRGTPAEFYTDNGTCFQGANKELEKEKLDARNNALAATFTTTTTKWRFIPPAAPHMGGAWERLVRSVKVALGTVATAPRTPDDEVLETALLEAEALINARPLTYIPLESADKEALTPNHFLLGTSNGDKVAPFGPVDNPAVLRSGWRLSQSITQEFWARWLKEYLPVITRQGKWFDDKPDIAVDDLVLVVSGSARDQWVRGRVEAVVPGRDGRVRQAFVRTATGVLRRPAVKLAVLDVRESSEPIAGVPGNRKSDQGSREGGCRDETPRYRSTVAGQCDGHNCVCPNGHQRKGRDNKNKSGDNVER
ncbi:uncharacterized protein LOC134286777 [Aedes albopictus]|uniref:Endonuclease n=1 Tax=Aedes albopictus TaxID=7160 RepID=A0ABM1YAK4_AEDAL